MTVYLLRHGRTAYNEQRRYQGRSDPPLSPAGVAELRAADFTPEPVYTSPLLRARQTARILFPAARQEVVAALAEMDFGDFEGRSFRDMEHDAAYRAWVDSGCLAPIPNGESRALFTARIAASLRALLRTDKSDRLTIVAHGGTLMAVCSVFVDPARDYFAWQPKNGGGYLLRTTGDPDRLEIAETYE